MLRLTSIGLFVLAVAVSCTGSDPEPAAAVDDAGASPDTGTIVIEDAGTVDAEPADAAACDAGLELCTSTCVDLQKDPNHCGACGHDCVGGECKAGKCAPVTIRDNLNRPYGVTTTGNNVLWYRGTAISGTQNGAVERCPTTGCPDAGATVITTEFYAPSANSPAGPTIVSDGSTVHWIARSPDNGDPQNYVFACPITGCFNTPKYASGAFTTWQLLRTGTAGMADNTLYFSNDVGKVNKCPFGNCVSSPTSTVTVFAQTDFTKTGLAADATRVFFWEAFDGTVYSCAIGSPSCAGASRTIQFKTAGSNHLAVGGKRLVGQNGTKVVSCSIDPAAPCADQPDTLATNQIMLALAADEKAAYWTVGSPAQSDGELRMCDLPKCAAGMRTLATGLLWPTSVHVADGVVYWSEAGTGGTTGSIKKIRP